MWGNPRAQSAQSQPIVGRHLFLLRELTELGMVSRLGESVQANAKTAWAYDDMCVANHVSLFQ